MSDKAKIISIKFLIEKYKKEIEDLKANDKIEEDRKIQSICIIREICHDLENIVNAN